MIRCVWENCYVLVMNIFFLCSNFFSSHCRYRKEIIIAYFFTKASNPFAIFFMRNVIKLVNTVVQFQSNL